MKSNGSPIISLDIGNGFTKALSATRSVSFASVAATEQGPIQFDGFNSADDLVIEFEGTRYAIGETAWKLGRMRITQMDRSRVGSDFYKVLFAAALAQVAPQSSAPHVVFSLPVSWYSDRETVKAKMAGQYKVCYGGSAFTYEIDADHIRIVPEGFGTVAQLVLNDKGEITNRQLADGRIGVVDVGTKTTDLILFDELEIIPTKSDGLETALDDVWLMMGEDISRNYGRSLEPHEVDRAMHEESFKHRGKLVDISKATERACTALARAISGKIASLWSGGDEVDNIMLSGGGSPFVAPYLDFEHKFLVDDGYMANCRGAYRYATFRSSRGGK